MEKTISSIKPIIAMKKPVFRILSILSSMAVAVVIAASCGGEEPEPAPTPAPTPTTVAVTGVSLNKTSLTITEGGSETLTATVSPGDATNKAVNWTSTDATVASVDGNGKVTAVKPGKASVIVSTADGGKTATCSVTVEAKTIPVTGVKLDKDTAELVEGEDITLTATISPEDATEKTVEWSTSKAEVATVENGKVTAVAPGTATVTVKTKDGGKTATCEVTVTAKPIPVEDVKIDIEAEILELTEGDETAITVTVTPEDASDKSVEWSSSDEAVATVDAEGKVTAVAPGTATITVTTKDGGKTAAFEVSVVAKTIPVENVALDKPELELTEGDEAVLTATVTPEDASDKSVEWTTSDAKVATVKDGKVTAVAPGTATVTVKTKDGGKTATCKVKVNGKVYPVEKVSLTETKKTVVEGNSVTLSVTFTPGNATNKKVTWSTSNKSVATVDSNGKVTGVKPGKATITVKTEDGGKTATCEVTVEKKTIHVEKVTLNRTGLTLAVGDEALLVATVTPADATNKKVTWSSSRDGVVSTDQEGNLVAKKIGTAVITVTTEDGGKTATCEVEVTAQYVMVKEVKLDKSSLTVAMGKTAQLTATVNPSDATEPGVTWSSSNESVAKVDQKGKITPVKPGNATITAKTSNNKSATCSVKVVQLVEGLTILSSGGNPIDVVTREQLYGGRTWSYQLGVEVSPSNATNKNVKWESTKTDIATVDQTGKVTFKKPGTTSIKVTANDGSKVTTSIAFVAYEVVADNISLKSSTGSWSMRVGGRITVTATLSYKNRFTPTYNEVTWSVNSNNVKIVSQTATTVTLQGVSPSQASYPVLLTAKAKSGDAEKTQQIGVTN